MKVKVLVVGKGAREHALAWKLSQQAQSVEHVFIFPGNGGTPCEEGAVPISNLTGVPAGISGYHSLAQTAKEIGIGLVVVGPDDDVVNGIEEYFRQGLSQPVTHPLQLRH